MSISITSHTLKAARASQPTFVDQAVLALDSSYPTGGYALSTALALKANLPGHELLHVYVEPQLPYTFGWDRANGKLKVYKEDGTSGVTAEVANATDLSAVTGLLATIISQ